MQEAMDYGEGGGVGREIKEGTERGMGERSDEGMMTRGMQFGRSKWEVMVKERKQWMKECEQVRRSDLVQTGRKDGEFFSIYRGEQAERVQREERRKN